MRSVAEKERKWREDEEEEDLETRRKTQRFGNSITIVTGLFATRQETVLDGYRKEKEKRETVGAPDAVNHAPLELKNSPESQTGPWSSGNAVGDLAGCGRT